MFLQKKGGHAPIDNTIDKTIYERFRFLRTFTYVGIFIGLILSLDNFFSGDFLGFYVNLLIQLALALNLLQIRLFKKYELGFAIAIASFAILILAFFLYGNGNIFVWIAPFGAATFFLLGSKKGLYVSMSILIMISILVLMHSIEMIHLPFPENFKELSGDFVGSIVILFLFILIFQESIEEKQKRILQSMGQLVVENRKDKFIFDTIEAGLITANEKGIVTFINEPGCILLSTTEKETVGKSLKDVLRFQRKNKDVPEKDGPLNEMLDKKPTKVILDDNIYIKRFDNSTFPGGMNMSYSNKNPETRIAIVFFDLSTEKEIGNLKDAFMSSMQHQISTPFSIIKWNIELLEQSEENLKKAGLTKTGIIDEIKIAIQRVMQTQGNILAVSRIEQGVFPKDLKDLDPKEIIEEVIAHLSPVLKRKGVYVNIDYGPNIRTINADKTLFSIIVDNIISNAIKYSFNDTFIEVRVKQMVDHILFKVTDKGIGIPKKDQEYIFEKFFRSENVTKKYFEGTGAGLYITKTLVSHLGGKIWFESAENAGTTFYIMLPNKAAAAAQK